MSRIAWSSPPSVQTKLVLPDPPPVEDVALADWLRLTKQAFDQLAQGSAEMEAFLDDLLDTVSELDRDSINSLTEVTETAGGAYTANEQTMLANLKTTVNGLLDNL